MSTATPVPNWPALLVAGDAVLRDRLASLDRVPALMNAMLPPFHPGDGLGGAVRTLAEALLFLGVPACQDRFDLLLPTLPQATRNMDPTRPGRVPTTQGLLSFVLVAQNAGALAEGTLQDELAALAQTMAQRDPPADAAARTSCGLLAGALGLELPARQLLGQSLPAFQPGQRHDDDPARLGGYLLEAIAAGAPLAAVEPAWQGFLRSFPRLLAAGRANWVMVHSVARLAWGRVGGLPVPTLAAHTHRQVMLAIAG
jgi:hypothetical protein